MYTELATLDVCQSEDRAFQPLQTRQHFFQIHEKVLESLIASNIMFDSLPYAYTKHQMMLVIVLVVLNLKSCLVEVVANSC